jgi:hypothetical protein
MSSFVCTSDGWYHGALLGVVSLLALASAAPGEPCTLYKPRDIENARENARRYRWAADMVKGWESAVQYAMEQDPALFDRMVPELTGWTTFGQNCPVCVGKKSTMGHAAFRWSVNNPEKLVCNACGTVYPHADFPETGQLVCARMGQRFSYFLNDEERAHPEDTSGSYAYRWAGWAVPTSWSGMLRTRKATWAAAQVLPLAKLYAITGEVRYAERCGWILERFARVYPGWLFHTYNGTVADCPPAEAAANLGKHGRGGHFPKDVIVNAYGLHQQGDHAVLCVGFWGADRFETSGCSSYLLEMTVAYDLIRGAKYPDGRPILDPETGGRIVRDLLLAGCADMENWNDINNKCGPGRALSAAAGILFDRPASVRRALHGFERLMQDCFHLDGFCKESPSYSDMHLGLLRNIPEILRGYSDPEGYTPPDGRRFRNLNPFDHVGRYRLALESSLRMLAPDRHYPTLGDTHHGAGGISAEYMEILTDRYDAAAYAGLLQAALGAPLSERGSEYALWYRDPATTAAGDARLPLHSEWFPDWHVSVMRAGEPQGQTALYLNAYADHGHRHMDTLGLVYYAFGQEIASDRGYIWDDPRNAWTHSTLSHNLVTVDASNQKSQKRTSTLELLGLSTAVEVTQASANAYDQCDRYQRTCALVRLPDGQTYGVDFFRVSGGKLHQYGFQCNGTMVNPTGPALQPVPDKIPWLTNLRASQPQTPWTATWQQRDLKMDLMLLSPADRLLVADAPGWRSCDGSELNAPPIQQIIAERRAAPNAAGLSSDYVAVMVPYRDGSPIKSARMLAPEGAAGALAVAVERVDGRTDYLLSAPDQAPRRYGPITMCGLFGFLSVAPDGQVAQAYLLAGSELACGANRIAISSPTVSLKVAAVEGRTFRLAEDIPGNLAVCGVYLLAADTGFEIESATANTITVRDYPAIACDRLTILNSACVTLP